jgi:hypothetical protein
MAFGSIVQGSYGWLLLKIEFSCYFLSAAEELSRDKNLILIIGNNIK